METPKTSTIESATQIETEDQSLDTWNRSRTNAQILGFLARREAEIFATNQ